MNSAETDLKVFWIRADQRWMSLRRQPGSILWQCQESTKWKNAELLNNVKLKHDLTWIIYAHILTTFSMLFIIKELTYPVLYIKYVITSLLMATFYHASHFRRLFKIILLTKQLLLWRWPPQFKTTNVSKFGRQTWVRTSSESTSWLNLATIKF